MTFVVRLLFLGLVVASGCTSLPGQRDPATTLPRDDPRWQAHRDALTEFDLFSLTARVAVQATDRGATAKLHWRQREDQYAISINSPLAGGAFELNGSPDGVTLVTRDGAVDRADSAEILIDRHLNLILPVAGVRYWVRGIPDPSLPMTYLALTEEGRASDFEQNRWRISVLEYRPIGDRMLPRRLLLARDDVQVRMVVDRWEPGP